MARQGRGLHLFGIPLVIHPSWLLALALIVFAVGDTTDLPPVRGLSPTARYAGGAIVAVLVFCSIVLHELAHALAARWCNLRVERITMYLFGGTAEINPDALTPRAEALTAAAGPAASASLALLLTWLWWLARPAGGTLALSLALLATTNGALGLLTILPGYPLDGGRIVRALLWYMTDDLIAATRLASLYGQFLAWIFLGIGAILLFSGGRFAIVGLGLFFCGWFLRAEARRGYRDLLWYELSKRIPTYHAAFLRSPRIVAGRTLQDVVDDVLEGLGAHNDGGPSLVVDEDDTVLGVLGLDELRRVRRANWPTTTASEAMQPLADAPTLSQDDPLASTLRVLPPRGPRYALVANAEGAPIGVVTRERITRLLARRMREGRGPLEPAARRGDDNPSLRHDR